jgi:hypothetical protein
MRRLHRGLWVWPGLLQYPWILNLWSPVVETGYYQRTTVDHQVYLDRHSTPPLFMLNSPFWGNLEVPQESISVLFAQYICSGVILVLPS